MGNVFVIEVIRKRIMDGVDALTTYFEYRTALDRCNEYYEKMFRRYERMITLYERMITLAEQDCFSEMVFPRYAEDAREGVKRFYDGMTDEIMLRWGQEKKRIVKDGRSLMKAYGIAMPDEGFGDACDKELRKCLEGYLREINNDDSLYSKLYRSNEREIVHAARLLDDIGHAVISERAGTLRVSKERTKKALRERYEDRKERILRMYAERTNAVREEWNEKISEALKRAQLLNNADVNGIQ